MFDGRSDCIKTLLLSAERVLRQGRDIYRENFEKRSQLWKQIEEAYDRYLNGECGEFIQELDKVFRGKFEASLAILALSFKLNRENFSSSRFNEEDLVFVDEITKFNALEVLSVDDIVKKLHRRDKNIYELLKTYYLGMDKWVEEQLENTNIALALRIHFRNAWNSYKEKLNKAIGEANKYDWFRSMLEDWEKEKKEIVEDFSQKVRELENRISEMRRIFEDEKSRIISDLSSKSRAEIERLKKDKEELMKKFEREREEIARAITEMKDKEIQERLQQELETVKRRLTQEIKMLEDSLRKKEEEIIAKEKEIRSKEDELKNKIAEILRMKESVERGSRFVKVEEARMMEMNFVERLKSKLREIEIDGRIFKAEKFSEFGIKVKDAPENAILEVDMKEKKLFGGNKLRILAFCFSRQKRFSSYGFDTDPMELGEVEKILSNFRRSELRTVLIISSPLGFEERIRKFVNSDEFHRNFYSENISLLLLDLETNEVIFNPNDPVARSLFKFVQLEIDEEVYTRVKNCILEKLKTTEYLPLNQAISCGDEKYVKRAFYEIAKDFGVVKYIDNFGLVLVKRR